MTLRRKKYTAFAVMLGIPVLLLLIEAGPRGIGADTCDIPIAVLILAGIAGFCLHLLWARCPHCGKEIDWDVRTGRKGN